MSTLAFRFLPFMAMHNQLGLPLASSPNESVRQLKQLLPYDGDASYHGVIYEPEKSDQLLAYFLHQIPWRHDEAQIYGKHYVTARKVAWYGDNRFSYTYSGKTRVALPWTKTLIQLKQQIEQKAGAVYNSCLLNLYADGSQGMAWHHDDEKGLGRHSNIASLTFGAERRFDFRHKSTKEKVSAMLEHGSLLIMAGETQACWQHQLPKTSKIHQPRVNLTFRKMLS